MRNSNKAKYARSPKNKGGYKERAHGNNSASMKLWRAANSAHVARHGMAARDAIRSEMIAAYGGECALCGENDHIVLVLDHVNNDGNKESCGGHSLYRRLRKENWPRDGYQLLCANCNTRKEFFRRRAQALKRIEELNG